MEKVPKILASRRSERQASFGGIFSLGHVCLMTSQGSHFFRGSNGGSECCQDEEGIILWQGALTTLAVPRQEIEFE